MVGRSWSMNSKMRKVGMGSRGDVVGLDCKMSFFISSVVTA